jgi:hypothetical protein
MAPNTLEQNTKGGYPLSHVPFLDGPDDWEDYRSGIQTYLVLTQQLEWLEDHEIKPNGPAAEKEWKRKHRLAITAMRDRVNYNAKDLTEGLESYQEVYTALEKNFQPRGDGTFIELSERFFNITLSEYKDIEDYTKALKKVRNQLSSLHVKIPEPLVIQRYLKGLGSAYNTFHTSFTTNNQILPDENGKGAVTFDFVSLKVKAEEKALAQRDATQVQALVAQATTTTPSMDTALAAPENTKLVEAPWCTHCNRSYHTKDNCFVLHPHLKGKSNSRKSHFRQRNKRSKRDDDDSDDPIGMIASLGMAASSDDTSNLLATQWAIDTACSRHITHSKAHFIKYELLIAGGAQIKGLGGTSCQAVGRGTVKIRCIIKGKSRAVHLTNVYHVPDCKVNLVSVGQLFKVGADVRFSPEKCKIHTKRKTLTATGRNGIWFLDTTME